MRALVVGIADYRHIPRLPAAVLNDARDLAARLGADPLYEGRVTLLENPDRHAFVAALETAGALCSRDDTFVLFISSHGARIADGPAAGDYLLPVDVAPEPAAFADTAISGRYLDDLVRAIPARRKLVILDCCHAAGVGFGQGASAGMRYDQLSEGDYVALVSSAGDQTSHVLAGARNSIFTGCLLEGLDRVKPKDGLVGIYEVAAYVQEHVSALAGRLGPAQTPWFRATTSASFAVVTALDRFDRDVFLNYHPGDHDFVETTLRPRLEQRLVRICTMSDPELIGMAALPAISHCATRARYTLSLAPREVLADTEARRGELAVLEALELGLTHERVRHVALLRPRHAALPLYLRIHIPASISDPPTERELDVLAAFLRKPHEP